MWFAFGHVAFDNRNERDSRNPPRGFMWNQINPETTWVLHQVGICHRGLDTTVPHHKTHHTIGNCLFQSNISSNNIHRTCHAGERKLIDLIAVRIYDKYWVFPSVRRIGTRCCFTMTNMIQVWSNFYWARVFTINSRRDEIVSEAAGVGCVVASLRNSWVSKEICLRNGSLPLLSTIFASLYRISEALRHR